MEFLIAEILTVILGLVSVFLGVKYRQFAKKARLFASLLNSVVSAAEDNRISEEELKRIIANAKQLAAKERDEAVD